MNHRPALAVLAAVALPLTLGAAPAHAGPLATQEGEPVVSERVNGTVATINTRANRIRLEDRTRVRYDSNDRLNVQHWYNVAEEDRIACELRDTGGEELFERLAQRADIIPVRLSGAIYADKDQESIIFLYADTCDGIIDELDSL